ncbi:DUF4149 domain-containing protein [Herbaspirillum sp. RTI4]|uniref:DUF4149 domain-containing protein n=1 Tax=Herbaspirillum sp. RTI4 TaxID=3048640 RepID=UPI002AB55360|nr:DUF4149 domain-containing protein [Herbaspirillum sp. RTI4]MDY7579585.1 DUF4149 domain-containing protein [Herbaspirillum sp. RTI4]MEA9981786.1 DUF4149 domain-containing protein [Herbaspirillum sp. RTI4]
MPLASVRILIATLWVGSLWAIGYVVAPTLFATLADRVLAGTIAGSLFRIVAWLSVVSAVLLACLLMREADPIRRRSCLRLIGTMLVCTLIGYFAVQPWMAGLRAAAGPGGVMESAAKMQFGALHGIASGIYLIQSLLGAALILKLR